MSTQTPFQLNATYTEDLTSIITQIEDKGIAILFTYIEDETSTVEAAITDNFVETNHAVQDHIAIKPRIYRLRGCVGEVVYKGSSEWLEAITTKINSHPVLQKTLNNLKPIASISGIVSNATQTAINLVNQLESSYNRYKKMIENNYIQAKQRQLTDKMQESIVADLNRVLELRLPVNLKGLKFEHILTAGDNYKRLYYLQSVSAHQGNNNFITDIEVTIKEFRIATTKVVDVDKNQYGALVPSKIEEAQENNLGAVKTQNIDTDKAELAPGTKLIKNTIDKLDSKYPGTANVIQKINNGITKTLVNVAKGSIQMFFPLGFK